MPRVDRVHFSDGDRVFRTVNEFRNNHRPRIVPVMHNNLMNRSRRSRILYRSLFPKSRHIVTVSTALPRAFLPDSVSLALEDPLACCTSPHESMSTCRHAAMPANRLRNAYNGSVAIVLPAPGCCRGGGSEPETRTGAQNGAAMVSTMPSHVPGSRKPDLQ